MMLRHSIHGAAPNNGKARPVHMLGAVLRQLLTPWRLHTRRPCPSSGGLGLRHVLFVPAIAAAPAFGSSPSGQCSGGQETGAAWSSTTSGQPELQQAYMPAMANRSYRMPLLAWDPGSTRISRGGPDHLPGTGPLARTRIQSGSNPRVIHGRHGRYPALVVACGPSAAGERLWLRIRVPGAHDLPGRESGLDRYVGPLYLDHHGTARWEVKSARALEGIDGLEFQVFMGSNIPGGRWVSSAVFAPVLGQSGLDGLTPDRVVISEIMKDPEKVSDSGGEWFELYNPTAQAVNVEGWSVSDLGSDFTILSNGGKGLWIEAGKALVLGRSADPAVNGGVHVDGTYSGMTLANGSDEVQLRLPDGRLVDTVAYDDGLTFPDDPGRSLSLDPQAMDSASNDLGSWWCSAGETWGGPSTDHGSPGRPNVPCR